MKIQYIHISDPENVRIYDTELSLKRNPFIQKSQKEWVNTNSREWRKINRKSSFSTTRFLKHNGDVKVSTGVRKNQAASDGAP